MLLCNSFARKVVATLGAAVGFVFVYETTIRDSRSPLRPGMTAAAFMWPTVGAPLDFTATAYCKGETTTSGVGVRTGVAAADPALLPVGSVVRLDLADSRYNGIWTVMDTGPAVQGRHIDIYIWSCNEALALGRRTAVLNVLRLGWNPKASTPSLIDRLFRAREAAQAAPND
jgi:3D (Asp-Asp-Asp) domain-containing protein